MIRYPVLSVYSLHGLDGLVELYYKVNNVGLIGIVAPYIFG